jgi:hypothetical protein
MVLFPTIFEKMFEILERFPPVSQILYSKVALFYNIVSPLPFQFSLSYPPSLSPHPPTHPPIPPFSLIFLIETHM